MAYVTKDESSLGINYFEYNVEKKPDAKIKLQRAGIFILDVFLVILLSVLIDKTLLIVAFCGLALLLAIMTFYLYKRTQIEYEYEINAGEITMAKIFGGRWRKTLFSQKLSSFHILAPYTEENYKRAVGDQKVKTFNCTSSPDAMDIYFGVFTDEKGEKTVVLLQAPKKAVSIFRFYNSSNTKIN